MDFEKNNINHPFKTPKNYFDGLEANILSEMNIDKIKALKNDVSEGYFENLEKNILSKTIETPSDTKTTFKVWKNPIFKYAASALLIGSLTFLGLRNFSSDPIDGISSEEIGAYLETESSNSEELVLAVEEINKSMPLSKTEINLENINSEDINSFLN